MKRILLISFLFLYLAPACKDSAIHLDGTGYCYHLRPCNAVNVNNAWLEEFSYKDEKIDEHGFVIIPNLQEESIAYDHYLLRILVNEVKREYPFFLYPPYIDDVAFEIDPDYVMEEQMKAYFEYKPRTRASLINIEYRNEALEDLKVFATKSLFGKEPGICLNDKILVYGGPESFYFDIDKNLIPIKGYPWGALADYMDFKPMTPAMLYLQLNEKPQEVPVTLRFAVEIKVEGKEPFRDTTRTITLL